jgi:hypothetical protein
MSDRRLDGTPLRLKQELDRRLVVGRSGSAERQADRQGG